MKKILSFVFTAISLFAVASCQIEDLDFVEKGDTQVTFKLGLPDDIATRGEELAVDHLDYAVYNEEGILVSEAVSLENVVFQGDTQSVQLTLVKGMSYTVAFWAQNSQCNAYTVVAGKEGMTVEVDYNGFNNDMTREAFFATESFKVDENLTVEVVLQRPFAKINLGVTTEDWNAAKAAGLNLTMSKVVIGAAPTTLDLLNDKVSGEAVVTYDYAPVPEQDFVVNEKNCKLLSSSFILADKEQSVISEGVEFTLKAENGKELTIEEGLENVPVQRNYATNLVAALTGDLDFSVSTDSDINGDTTIPTGDVDAFKAALADPSTTEIVLPYGVYEGVFLIEKGPKTIKSADPEKQVIIRGKVGVAADVKFENITFDVHDEFSKRTTGNANVDKVDGRERAIVPVYAAKATFEGCNFLNIYDAREVAAIHYGAYKLGSPLEINNCYFEGYAYAIYSRALLTVTNSTFKQNHNTANPRAIFLYGLGDGNGNAPQGNVVFMNNTAAGKASYTMEMSSSTYKGDYTNIHYNVQGNTNFSVDNQAFLPRIEEGWDFTGTTFAEGSETFEFGIPAGDVEAFKAALADPSTTEIVLPYGVYEGVFLIEKGPKTIKSADPEKQVIIRGKVGVAADVKFENITFDVHDEFSKRTTGNANVDKVDGRERAIVPVYAAKATFEGCNFLNIYDAREVAAIHYGAYKLGSPLEINNCYFEGYAYAIYSRALLTVTNSTFKQNHNTANPRAIFLYGLGDGNGNAPQGNVVFMNNTAAGKASYTMEMSSSTYKGDYTNIHYNVQGNTNFSVDNQAFLPRIEEGWDFTGTTFAEGSETFEFGIPAGDVEAFNAALADPSVTEIVLPYGLYEGLFIHKYGPKTIKSADPARQAVIKGKVAVLAEVAFEDITFDVHNSYSVDPTGISADFDDMERRRDAIVPVYLAKASFKGCSFYNLYDERNVVAIHYGDHKVGATLEVDDCYFEGYAYAIYSRALVTVTNSTFKQTHSEVNPRAIFLYGLGDGNQGNVVFKNNTAAGKTSYTMQMMSSNYNYKKIHYDVQGNTNFSVDGKAFLPDVEKCDFTGTTFAEGSETFDFPVDADDVLDLSNYPAGDVAAFKAALADPSVTEIVLPYGLYEGLFFHTKGAKTIKSADPAKPAVIKGKVAVSNANLAFENVLFDVHDKYSVEATGDSQIDKIEGRRKAIVTIYAAEVTFDGCKFYNLYDNRNVVAIHYGAHVTGATLGVNNCYFQGYAYAIYTRALVSVTNSTFNQTHPEAYPRAIFLYGLGDGKQGNVVFKNNTAKGKTSYTMQMSSTNYDYKKIHYDVQGNKNFSVEGDAFLARTDGTCDFTGTTFAQGSATFEF